MFVFITLGLESF